MSVVSKMTLIADKIRELLGISSTMGLDAMKSNLDSAVSEVDTQAILIEEVQNALDYKIGNLILPETSVFTPSSNTQTAIFTGLTHMPTLFLIVPTSNITLNYSTRYVISVNYIVSGGIAGIYSTTSTATTTYDGFSFTYDNGTLTVTTTSATNGGYFRSGVQYGLIYV